MKNSQDISPQELVEQVFQVYAEKGQDDYIGEAISQIEHACQSAQMAVEEGYDDEVILAAFLHDIGHLCAKKDPRNDMDGYGMVKHEKVGANFLRRRGFSERVAQLVENHVQAKRYLTFKNPDYYDKLSEASKNTLEFQGGKMSATEATAFEKDPLFETSLKMREWDERAKEVGVPLPDLTALKERALRHVRSNM
jgi:phosphonate degradation associated HDIG domain protein